MKVSQNPHTPSHIGGFSVIEAVVALLVLAGIVVLALAWMTGSGAAA